ncbi:HlyD family type I secretion periplasmic adaptor subunit [Roseobacter ponti]|uniref:Membrane fusion protein (MFP) family protein n=1 Tax=Roseobacter ponti TaxID=1891787 RepID=A0A858SNB4_9RHOB|nr:HlyD family type I secretion periplasmic adaptor subunit [Roseobacter ponti]QJF50329.1 HlyD family type I secretion periplasmic adaptor subunit [Roseobacter ponti]
MSKRWSAKWPLITGAVSVVILLGGMGYWSVNTEIAGAVIANGRLQVENDSQVVQHPDGGVVQDILVRDGDRVAAGDTLIRLDDVFLRTELVVIEGQLAEIYVRKARLQSERDGATDLSYGPAPEFVLISRQEVEDQKAGQLDLFRARIESNDRNRLQIRRQQRQVEDKIDSLQAQVTAVETQAGLIGREIKDVETLVEKGLVQVPRLLELQRSAAELEGRSGSLRGQIAESRTRISTLELELLRLDDERREGAITQLRDLEVNERELTERRIALLERMGRLSIVAPVSGVVFGSQVFAERAVIRAADPLLYLVPSDQPLHISAKIEPTDIDQIFPGQEVALIFSSFSRRTTPEGSGVISVVSADATTDETTGMPFYEAVVSIDDASMEALSGLDLIPGMPVETYIKTDLRTPMSYMVQPLAIYFKRAFREE